MTKSKITNNLTKKLGALKQNKVSTESNKNIATASETNNNIEFEVSNTDKDEFVDGIKTASEELQDVIACDFTGSNEPEVVSNYISKDYFDSSINWGLKKPLVAKKGPYPTDVNYVYYHSPFLDILTIKTDIREGTKDNTVFRKIERLYEPIFD